MNAKLREDDARVVDLLMDRAVVAQAGQTAFAGHGLQPRLNAAERVLHLLDALAPGDPPVDLVARTMRRIEDSVQGTADLRNGPFTAPSSRPLA